MLEDYFTTQGREWERYAWVKARLLSGDRGAALDAIVSAIRVPAPSRLQRARQPARAACADPPGSAAARDRGQHQARSRRHPRDRVPGAGVPDDPRRTRSAVAGAADAAGAGAARRDASCCRPTAVAELRAAYVFLRNLEHRLQYLDDQQTQMLPRARRRPRRLIAEMMGYARLRRCCRELDVAPRRRHAAFRSDLRQRRATTVRPIPRPTSGCRPCRDDRGPGADLPALGLRRCGIACTRGSCETPRTARAIGAWRHPGRRGWTS